MVEVGAGAVRATPATEQRAGRVGGSAGSHCGGATRLARGRGEAQLGTKAVHHVIADLQVGDASAEFSTTPAPPWPSTIGGGRGRLPSITERSEWQRPTARILQQHLPGPEEGRARRRVISSGRESAGRGARLAVIVDHGYRQAAR